MSSRRLLPKSVIVTLAALVFLSSIAALYRSDGPRRFQTKVYKYTEYYQDTSPHHTSTTSGPRPIAPPGTERNGGLGEIYTNKAEWVAQKVKVANGEIKEWEKPDEERLKNDERRLMMDIPKMHLPTFPVPSMPLTTAPEPSQIAILTASDGGGHNGDIPHVIEQAVGNRDAYARLHGYVHQFINISDYDVSGAHPVWKKIPAIIDCFRANPEVQWVWWLDLDAVIMTASVDLSDYLLSPEALDRALLRDTEIMRSGPRKLGLKTPKEYDISNLDLLITQDENGLNAGSFFLRRSAFTQMLLRLWVDPLYMSQDWILREQDVLGHLVNAHDFIRSHVGLVKQNYINAYRYGSEDEVQWQPGKVVVHFAGCWVGGKCKEDWEEYMAKADEAVRVDGLGKPVGPRGREMGRSRIRRNGRRRSMMHEAEA